MKFTSAFALLKEGEAMRLPEWPFNAFIYLVDGSSVTANGLTGAAAVQNEKVTTITGTKPDRVKILPHIDYREFDTIQVGWTPSITDLMSDKWEVFGEGNSSHAKRVVVDRSEGNGLFTYDEDMMLLRGVAGIDSATPVAPSEPTPKYTASPAHIYTQEELDELDRIAKFCSTTSINGTFLNDVKTIAKNMAESQGRYESSNTSKKVDMSAARYMKKNITDTRSDNV